MKRILLDFLHFLFNLKTFRKIVNIFNWEYSKYEAKIICKNISPLNKVLNGPFKDLTYPSLESVGSGLLPKILGSYENELHEIIYSILNNNYSEIIDVGCAEGYYAVGLAKKINFAKIYAFDNDKRAINLCRQMAEKNNVAEKIVYGDFCSSETLAKFGFSKKGLIISDCEGYEVELFTKKNIANLVNCDILIEMHNLVNPNVKEYFENLFKDSHNIKIIESKLKHIDDYPELKSINMEYYHDTILLERDTRMEWMFLTPKK